MICVIAVLLSFVVQWSLFCQSYVIQPGVWKYRNKYPIAYEETRKTEDAVSSVDPYDNATPVLLLNGFGVGSFHQHRLIQELMQTPNYAGVDDSSSTAVTNRVIYGMDYLGQGKSWPEDCADGNGPTEQGLRYCGQMWVDQIIHFIEQVVLEDSHGDRPGGRNQPNKVHIVGNSVGGHLAVCVAASRPDLVESIVLLNATPVWGLNLPGWSGHLPAPAVPKAIGRYLFDQIRNLNTIQQYLANAYVNEEAFDETLMKQIRSCTEGDGGHAAFASILWSPPVTVKLNSNRRRTSDDMHAKDDSEILMADFDACLRSLQCDVLLLFGRDDPWCKPAFGKRMLRDLRQRHSMLAPSETPPVERYVQLSQVGHCPNHEAPAAVARILSLWLDPQASATESRNCRSADLLNLADRERIQESWGETTVEECREEEIPLSWADKLAIQFV